MFVDFSSISPNETVAIAVSGGIDSMALLHYAKSVADKHFNVICINVEHGIRGSSSIADSNFVKSYCEKNKIPFLGYTVDSVSKSKMDKISIETAARLLRYDCFFDALNTKKCDKIATAHHKKDNFETVLFNIFRGTGIKGLSGIVDGYDGKIIRPLISVTKKEIVAYVKKHKIPFVTDQTNEDDKITRNNVRLNLIPKIEEIFPDAEDAVFRLSKSSKLDEEFILSCAKKSVVLKPNTASIKIPIHYSVFARSVIISLKHLGINKDWEKVHIDEAYSLIEKENGASFNLLNNVVVSREYDKIVFTVKTDKNTDTLPFKLGEFKFGEKNYSIKKASKKNDYKNGLYLDLDKIPKNATIRVKKDGDLFTKFGGGTKKLNDYLTDIKIPKREREFLPVIAEGNTVYAILGVAISEKVKIDGATRNIIKLS